MIKTVSMEFSKEIYQEVVVKRAINDYSNICHIDLIDSTQSYICVFLKSRADLELTAYEFGNYLIELANVRDYKI